jgi:hypothetical protein
MEGETKLSNSSPFNSPPARGGKRFRIISSVATCSMPLRYLPLATFFHGKEILLSLCFAHQFLYSVSFLFMEAKSLFS